MVFHATQGSYHTPSRYYELSVEDVVTGKTRAVYSGDPHTHNWEWTSDNKIKITYNCGTSCLASKIIDINKHTSIIEFYRQKAFNEKNGWSVQLFDEMGD